MRKTLLVIASLFAILMLVLVGVGIWASSAASAHLARTLTAHSVDFPIPFPLTEAELETLRQTRRDGSGEDADPLAGVDLAALARERAIERGRHLVEARYACIECHGNNFGGGTMLDDPAIGTFLGSNLTAGRGSKVATYTAADWDRSVRHGVLPDGRPSIMPADDYQLMSDRELSDVVSYIRSFPPVDSEVPVPTLGPVGKMLLATGKLVLSADKISDHHTAHPAEPPAAEVTEEFGRHLAGICTGCHRADLNGGPIAAGPPDWPPASNLTPHEQGIKGWTFEQFEVAMVQGKRPDGRELRMPMSMLRPYMEKLTDTERRALWAYLQRLPAQPTGL